MTLAKVDVSELAIVLSVLALCVAVRLMRLQPIEFYEDEVSRWHFVRQWFYPNDFHQARWTHHMARFGVNVPVFVVQALFGRHAHAYYIWPVTAFTLQVLFTYLTTKRLAGRGAAVLAAIFLITFTGMDRGASQLLPDGIGAAAMILVGYLLIRYQEAPVERRMSWLLGAALAFVWAYEIKESNLLLLPGTAAAVWLCKGRFRDGVWFCAVLFAAIALETLGFRALTHYHSRFAIVEESHGVATTTFLHLFDRFTKLEPPWQMLVWMWVPSALWLASSGDRRRYLLALIPATFLFLITFLVRGVNPIVLWTRFFSRYFEPMAPFFTAAVALFVAHCVARMWENFAPAKLSTWQGTLSRHAAAVSVVACGVVGLAEYASNAGSTEEPVLHEVRRISSITNDAYARNLPIVERRAKSSERDEERRTRPLKAVYGIFLDDRRIVTSDLAKDGWLPNTLEAIRHSKRYSYLLHDARVYGRERVEKFVDDGCAVVLTEAKGHLNSAAGVPSLIVAQTEKLPARCKAPQD